MRSTRHSGRQLLTEGQQKLVARIKHLHSIGEPLNISAVRNKHPELLKAVYKNKPFWGWKQALHSAGISYSQIRTKRAKNVKCMICGRKSVTLFKHIQMVHDMAIEDYTAEYPGAELMSESYSSTSRRGNKEPAMPHWEKNWTPEYVLDRLHEFHRKGFRLNALKMQKAECVTYEKAVQYFRNWNTALLAIGLDPAKEQMRIHGKWDRQSIIAAISKLHAEGKEVNFGAILKYDKSLAPAAEQRFGGYDKALRACGLDPAKIIKHKALRKYRMESHVIDAICRRKLEGKPLNCAGVTRGEHTDFHLMNQGCKLFGTWKAAIEAAGLDYDKIRIWGVRYKTTDEILKEIQRRHAAGLPLRVTGIREGPNKDTILYRDSHRHFKNWRSALKAAGIDRLPSRHQLRVRYPTEEAVINELRARHKRGQPVTPQGLTRGNNRDQTLYVTARRYYGSFATALKKAGITDVVVRDPAGKYPNRQAVLREIRKRFSQGLPLAARIATSSAPYSDRSLYLKAKKLFGRWESAVRAAGIDYSVVLKQRRRYPSKEAVIAEIVRRHGAGITVSSNGVLLGAHRDVALFTTARKEFGSWPNACRIAGLDYDAILKKRRKYPTKESILEEIRRRTAAADSHRDQGLHESAVKEFGSWGNALREAGVMLQ